MEPLVQRVVMVQTVQMEALAQRAHKGRLEQLELLVRRVVMAQTVQTAYRASSARLVRQVVKGQRAFKGIRVRMARQETLVQLVLDCRVRMALLAIREWPEELVRLVHKEVRGQSVVSVALVHKDHLVRQVYKE